MTALLNVGFQAHNALSDQRIAAMLGFLIIAKFLYLISRA
jgi:hypothetical protein